MKAMPRHFPTGLNAGSFSFLHDVAVSSATQSVRSVTFFMLICSNFCDEFVFFLVVYRDTKLEQIIPVGLPQQSMNFAKKFNLDPVNAVVLIEFVGVD